MRIRILGAKLADEGGVHGSTDYGDADCALRALEGCILDVFFGGVTGTTVRRRDGVLGVEDGTNDEIFGGHCLLPSLYRADCLYATDRELLALLNIWGDSSVVMISNNPQGLDEFCFGDLDFGLGSPGCFVFGVGVIIEG